MFLSEWIRLKGRGAIADLARRTGLNYTTVWPCARGEPAKTYAVAKRISTATGGEVSITELFEPVALEPASEGASQ